MQIIPVASGKGGVGKSLFAANVGIALAKTGKKVVLADLDLGASNLHLALGMQRNKHGIGTFLTGASSFDDIVLETNYNNLSFIAGDSEIPGFASLKIYEKKKLISNILNLNADYVILDLGAGTSIGVLDFFLLSPQGILITAPTVTAILDAYLFLKNIVFRIVVSSFPKKSPGAAHLTKLQNDAQLMQRLYIPTLISELDGLDPKHSATVKEKLAKFKPRLVLNMVEKQNDPDKALKLRASCKQYLDLDLEHLGVIAKDSTQDIALASRLPVTVYKPTALISQGIFRIAEKILASADIQFDGMSTLDYEEYSDDSFNLAETEAETDTNSRLSYLEDLVGSRTFSADDLYEIIKSQAFEISSLKKQNTLLKAKIKQALEQGFLS